MHQLILLGRIATDVEVRTSKAGKPYTKLVVASNYKHMGEDATLWVNVMCFGKLSDYVSMNARKGEQIYVDGTLTVDAYTSKDGEARGSLTLFPDNLRLLGAKPAKQEQGLQSFVDNSDLEDLDF
ncbi:MAG: single-stranded DNA-binding protein [Thiofilum sp.]|uniref:single-stranded DNA-binding protein n=1 Tax=Thiofilum sp. TaxID=2212733 RepID=UPI0025F823B7|nr:single-stranded DNA-binding protein [Thiofilum sp.]MBK8455622.1 single-stranded DNA-binding protein [Thiofilum sp.]